MMNDHKRKGYIQHILFTDRSEGMDMCGYVLRVQIWKELPHWLRVADVEAGLGCELECEMGCGVRGWVRCSMGCRVGC